MIETEGLHNDRRHGFKPCRGTDTALATLHETIAIARGSGQTVDLVFWDISRAFDKVWHDGLKYKIRQCDFPDCLTRILCSYLTDRTTRIRIGDFDGPEFRLRSGVPQGGCLSLTLFNLCTLDLDKPTGQADYLAYADAITQIIPSHSKSRKMHALATTRAIQQIDTFENKCKIIKNKDKFTLISLERQKTEDIRLKDRTIQLGPL